MARPCIREEFSTGQPDRVDDHLVNETRLTDTRYGYSTIAMDKTRMHNQLEAFGKLEACILSNARTTSRFTIISEDPSAKRGWTLHNLLTILFLMGS
jgi:hypothetical protein